MINSSHSGGGGGGGTVRFDVRPAPTAADVLEEAAVEEEIRAVAASIVRAVSLNSSGEDSAEESVEIRREEVAAEVHRSEEEGQRNPSGQQQQQQQPIDGRSTSTASRKSSGYHSYRARSSVVCDVHSASPPSRPSPPEPKATAVDQRDQLLISDLEATAAPPAVAANGNGNGRRRESVGTLRHYRNLAGDSISVSSVFFGSSICSDRERGAGADANSVIGFDYATCISDAIRHMFNKALEQASSLLHFRAPKELSVMGQQHSSSVVSDESVEVARKTGVLVLANRGITDIPSKVFSVSSTLRLLDLSANRLSDLPSSAGEMTNVRSLFLNQNRLSALPEHLGGLARLESLSVSYNFLQSLPRAAVRWERLRELKLSCNRLTEIPQEVFSLSNLELLDLSMNQIEEVPPAIGLMAELCDLNLNENRVCTLCNDLSRMPRLQILRLQNNQLNLNAIPDSLFVESQCTQILLEGNLFELSALSNLEGYDFYLSRNARMRRRSTVFATSAPVLKEARL